LKTHVLESPTQGSGSSKASKVVRSSYTARIQAKVTKQATVNTNKWLFGHNSSTRNARWLIKGSKDSHYSLISIKNRVKKLALGIQGL